eukprot:Colp12_sorted_trinity150504_noHs@25567
MALKDLLCNPDLSREDILASLKLFCLEKASVFKFPEFALDEKRGIIEKLLTQVEKWKTDDEVCASIWETLRILCRERYGVEPLFSEGGMQLMVNHTGFNPRADPAIYSLKSAGEAVKCLMNTVFDLPERQQMLQNFEGIAGIFNMLQMTKGTEPNDVQLFGLRILFLVTARNQPSIPHIRDELNGLQARLTPSCILHHHS